MKTIVSMVQPFRLGKGHRRARGDYGLPGMTVSDVRGFGREKSSPQEGSTHRVIEDFVRRTVRMR
ncbi:MAG: hypothetical protein IPF53_16980 [Blastocatellia bacterium]|nr:hypothetical protein [Blastocatellia bacterium]